MTEAPYAPPAADLGRPRENAPFFAVSQAKLAILSLTTLSVYQFWWLYKSWAALRAHGQQVSPFWRASFAPVTCYSLFVRLEERGKTHDLRMALWPGVCATAYFALSMLFKLPDPWFLLTYLSFVPLMPANGLARELNEREAAAGEPLVPWSPANVLWAVFAGAPLVGLVLYGAFGGAP